MKLSKFDNKLVRIIDGNNDVFEGYASYNNLDYHECEFGFKEDGLQILNYIFLNNDIKSVEVIDKFSENYGLLERLIVESGLEEIKDVFDYEDEEHKYRILLCIEDNLEIDEEVSKFLTNYLKYTNNKKIINKIKALTNS